MVGQCDTHCNNVTRAKVKKPNNDWHFLVAPDFMSFQRVLKDI
jgi:hypothetical protein